MCDDWRGFLGQGLVTSGWRCNREMEVCHYLLELVGELLVGAGKI